MERNVEKGQASMRTCVYPGSFDPFTIGHHDVLERAIAMFDRVYVSVLNNASKHPVFSVEERVEMIQRMVEAEGMPNVVVTHFDGLMVDYARAIGAAPACDPAGRLPSRSRAGSTCCPTCSAAPAALRAPRGQLDSHVPGSSRRPT